VEYALARWAECEDRNRLKAFQQENGRFLANDAEGHLTFLAPSEWRLENTMKQWPEVTFHKTREHS
jgi:peptide chain release factor 3